MTEQQPTTQRCPQCDVEFERDRISCPSCGLPVAKEGMSDQKRYTLYFVGLIIFCALVILIAPR